MNTNLRYLADNGMLSLNDKPAYLHEIVGQADAKRMAVDPSMTLESIGRTAENTLGMGTYITEAMAPRPIAPLPPPPLSLALMTPMLPMRTLPPRNPFLC